MAKRISLEACLIEMLMSSGNTLITMKSICGQIELTCPFRTISLRN